MNEHPLVSVIIPTFNRAHFLKQAIESALSQTYPSVEIIVVDDGSSDQTPQVVEPYLDRVQYIRQENSGIAAARNRGLQAAHGTYINFLDDDDLFRPEKLAHQVAVLENRPEVGLVHCRYEYIDQDGQLHSRVGPMPEGDARARLLRRQFVRASAALIRRSWLDKVGPFNEKLSLASEHEMLLRIALAGSPFACVQQHLCAYRVQRGQKLERLVQSESEFLQVIEWGFQQPGLPAELKMMRKECLAGWHFFFSLRYYAVERWEDAQRNLAQALADNPLLASAQDAFFSALIQQALDNRVQGAQRYLIGVFAHLPPAIASMVSYRDVLLAWTQVGLALRFLQSGKTDDAQTLFLSAITDYPDILIQTDTIAQMVATTAMSMAPEPDTFVELMFDQLPAHAMEWGMMRRRVRADVNIACAFDDYFIGHYRSVVQRVWKALMNRPAWLTNRGVLSILVKSSWAVMRSRRQPKK